MLKLSERIHCLLLILLFSVSHPLLGNNGIVLQGSTPGNSFIKTVLNIPETRAVDFIRWQLTLNSDMSFYLEVWFGLSQPNTLGFTGGGESKSCKGRYSITRTDIIPELLLLESRELTNGLRLAKLNESLFHLADHHNRLLIGNGGWSYSLNRKDAVSRQKIALHPSVKEVRSRELVFEGRTPCQEIISAHPESGAKPDCFKIKWKLVLYRDPVSMNPTSCAVRNIVNNAPRDVKGTWEARKGMAGNPDAIVYVIRPDNLKEPLFLYVADDNLLFFIDQEGKVLPGNGDFSYVLNRRK